MQALTIPTLVTEGSQDKDNSLLDDILQNMAQGGEEEEESDE